jgi:large subunit ribosomal protein L31e
METIYTIPLGKVYETKPCYRRSSKAVAFVKSYISKHKKVEEDSVIIDKSINESIWQRGAKKPPRKLQIKVSEETIGEGDKQRKIVKASLV